MKVKVEITETLQRTVEVEAQSEEEALEQVKAMYRQEEIVLDSTDFVGNDFQVLPKETYKGEVAV